MNEAPRDAELEVSLLLEAIFQKYSHDFRQYSRASLGRRLSQAVGQLGVGTISGLQERLFVEPTFFNELMNFLTISTSEMFRDPAYYKQVRECVVPILKTYPSLKVWIAGCSTGEELYSLAILFHEEGLGDRTIFYATDINRRSLQRAETGIFAAESIPLATENYRAAGGRGSLAEYFTADYGSVKMDAKLRRNVVFSDHSLATDSVFSETQFVSCRNVLIYFDKSLQERAIDLFHQSLCYKGFLGLGSRETLRFSRLDPYFTAFAAAERIYQKK